MKIGIYGDVHITKSKRNLQSSWNTSILETFTHMYEKFDEESVSEVICLGDFFDAPVLEARHLQLVIPILDLLESRSYPTFILLGNHELYSGDSNILDILNSYNMIVPITSVTDYKDFYAIPYSDTVEDDVVNLPTDKLIVTHMDLYGSNLAAGKVKALFGISPAVFSDCKIVMNGHVHLRSQLAENVLNAGAIVIGQQGELLVGDYPQYYIYDVDKNITESYDNIYSMLYLTVDSKDLDKLDYITSDTSKLVLKVEYAGTEMPELPENLNVASITYRKQVTATLGDKSTETLSMSNFDLASYLVDYIRKDDLVLESQKEDYIKTALEVVS